MAIFEITYYYYFVTKRGVTTIKKSVVKINTEINRNYVELTKEQVEFYLANPTASVEEVRNCKLNSVIVPPAYSPELSDYKANAIEELKALYCSSIKVSELDYAAAMVDVMKQANPLKMASVDSTMNDSNAVATLKSFASSYNSSKSLYDGFARRVNSATDVAGVDSVMSEAKEAFKAL